MSSSVAGAAGFIGTWRLHRDSSCWRAHLRGRTLQAQEMKDDSTAGDPDALERLDRILERQLSWIGAADAKAALVFAIASGMLAVMVSVLPRPSSWNILTALLACLAAVLLIGSVVCVVVANWPRLKGPKGSVVYFGGICSFDEEQYTKRVCGATIFDMMQDYARQCHRNAEIAQAKYIWVHRASVAMCASFPAWLTAIWLLHAAKETV